MKLKGGTFERREDIFTSSPLVPGTPRAPDAPLNKNKILLIKFDE